MLGDCLQARSNLGLVGQRWSVVVETGGGCQGFGNWGGVCAKIWGVGRYDLTKMVMSGNTFWLMGFVGYADLSCHSFDNAGGWPITSGLGAISSRFNSENRIWGNTVGKV